MAWRGEGWGRSCAQTIPHFKTSNVFIHVCTCKNSQWTTSQKESQPCVHSTVSEYKHNQLTSHAIYISLAHNTLKTLNMGNYTKTISDVIRMRPFITWDYKVHSYWLVPRLWSHKPKAHEMVLVSKDLRIRTVTWLLYGMASKIKSPWQLHTNSIVS